MTTLRQPFCRRIDELTDLTWDDEWPECERSGCDPDGDEGEHAAEFVIGGPTRLGQFVCRDCAERFCESVRIRLPEDDP
jgi:hypothetical protein